MLAPKSRKGNDEIALRYALTSGNSKALTDSLKFKHKITQVILFT